MMTIVCSPKIRMGLVSPVTTVFRPHDKNPNKYLYASTDLIRVETISLSVYKNSLRQKWMREVLNILLIHFYSLCHRSNSSIEIAWIKMFSILFGSSSSFSILSFHLFFRIFLVLCALWIFLMHLNCFDSFNILPKLSLFFYLPNASYCWPRMIYVRMF